VLGRVVVGVSLCMNFLGFAANWSTIEEDIKNNQQRINDK
jgi:hypothetical protein